MKAYSGEENVKVTLGNFSLMTLDRENSMNPDAKVHMAFVRYNGMIPKGNEFVLAFEIGEYNGHREDQQGHPYYLPSTENMIICRVNTRGNEVKLKIVRQSPLEIIAEDLIERQTAIRD